MKKNLLYFFCLLLLAAYGCRTVPEKETFLVLSSHSRYQIVYPDRYKNRQTTELIRSTAEKLRHGFKETIGADFPVVSESRRKNGVKSIFLGNTRVLKAKGVKPLYFPDLAFTIWEYHGNIYIAGCDRQNLDSRHISRDHRNCILGTTAGVLFFMEKFLGCAFLYPGENGTDYVKKSSIMIPELYKYKHPSPGGMITGPAGEFFLDYALGITGPAGYKEINDLFTAVKSGKDNIDHRSAEHSSKVQLYISDRSDRSLIWRRLLQHLDRGVQISGITLPEDYELCSCKDCGALPGDNAGEKIWRFLLDTAKFIKSERPGKKLAFTASGAIAVPPALFREFPDNVMIKLPDVSPKTLAAWKKIKLPAGFIADAGSSFVPGDPDFTPRMTPEYASTLAKRLREYGIRNIIFRHYARLPGLETPVYALFRKLWLDPDMKPEKFMDDYYVRAFHESSIHAKKFFELLYSRIAIYKKVIGGERSNTVPTSPGLLLSIVFPPEQLAELEKLLKKAEKAAASGKVVKRLALIRKEFDYLKNRTVLMAIRRECVKNPTTANRQALETAEKNWKKMMTSPEWRKIPGWPEVRTFGGVPSSRLSTEEK